MICGVGLGLSWDQLDLLLPTDNLTHGRDVLVPSTINHVRDGL